MEGPSLQMLSEAYQSVYSTPNDDYEVIVGFLASEGLVESYEEADELIEQMSDEDILGILDEANIVRTGVSVNAAGEKIPWTHTHNTATGTSTVEDKKFGTRILRQSGLRQNIQSQKIEDIKSKRRYNESYDAYDIVLEHLLDEGYADCEENALVIMSNMSEEWMGEILDEAYQTPRFKRKHYLQKLSKRGGMGMGTPEDPHGYRDPKMAKVGAEFSKRKTAEAKAKKTGEEDEYKKEKRAQSKLR